MTTVPPMSGSSYTIRGGRVGRDRLRVLARVKAGATRSFLEGLRIPADATCLDVGCGGGDVSLILARLAPLGQVRGTDRDPVKVKLARAEAAGIENVEFDVEDVTATIADTTRSYDFVYARFLLSHLPDPASLVSGLAGLVAPGGLLAVEDIQMSAAFCAPPSAAFYRYRGIYCDTVRANGGNPELGPELPLMLYNAGLRDIDARVAQPAGLRGDVKMIHLLTLDAIIDAALAAGVATEAELDRTATHLQKYFERDDTFVATPRVVQVAGRRPARRDG